MDEVKCRKCPKCGHLWEINEKLKKSGYTWMTPPKKKTKRTKWTVEDDNTIRQRYGKMLSADLAGVLGRTRSAVWARARHLGVKKHKRVVLENKW